MVPAATGLFRLATYASTDIQLESKGFCLISRSTEIGSMPLAPHTIIPSPWSVKSQLKSIAFANSSWVADAAP